MEPERQVIVILLDFDSVFRHYSSRKNYIFKCVNEEKVTVAGCSSGSKEFLRQKVDKNVANKKHRNTPRINNNKYT